MEGGGRGEIKIRSKSWIKMKEGLTPTVRSALTEIYEADCGAGEIHSSLGRDGRALGNQPDRGAGACAALPVAETDQCGGTDRNAERGAVQREQQHSRIAEL